MSAGVSDEAVEAAAERTWDEVWSDAKLYAEASDAETDECRSTARAWRSGPVKPGRVCCLLWELAASWSLGLPATSPPCTPR